MIAMARARIPISAKLWVGISVVVALRCDDSVLRASARDRQRLVAAKVAASVMVTDILAPRFRHRSTSRTRRDQDGARLRQNQQRRALGRVFASADQRLFAASGSAEDGMVAALTPPRARVSESVVTVTKKI
jgi:hypothetical protein